MLNSLLFGLYFLHLPFRSHLGKPQPTVRNRILLTDEVAGGELRPHVYLVKRAQTPVQD